MTTVFFDIDTQLDFVVPSGALYVPAAERLISAVARLNQCAAGQGIPVISTTDAHTERDTEFETWPPHCVAGTLGQRKPEATLLPRRGVVSTAPGARPAPGVQQIVLEKQALDCFTNPNLEAILDELGAVRFVVYGVVTEFCVRCAALGLLRRGGKVEVVADAIRSLSPGAEARTREEIVAAGGRFVTAAEVVGQPDLSREH